MSKNKASPGGRFRSLPEIWEGNPMSDAIPVIDLTDLETGNPQALARIAHDIGNAARDIGFFYVRNHGVAADLIDAAFAASAKFFALPTAEKAAIAIDKVGANRGYAGLLTEALDPTRPADLKEAFNIGFDDPATGLGADGRGRNAWPRLDGFQSVMQTYFDAVLALGRRLHRAIAVDLGLEPDFFADKLDHPLATLRLLHYPPHPADALAGQIGAGAHTDYGNITLLATDAVGGLEVCRRDGVWVAAPVIPGTFVVNIGDSLMRWSNDVYVSNPHRVVNRGNRERWSIAFFLDANPDAVISALPGCVAPGAVAKYPPVTMAAYLRQRLNATYGAAVGIDTVP